MSLVAISICHILHIKRNIKIMKSIWYSTSFYLLNAGEPEMPVIVMPVFDQIV